MEMLSVLWRSFLLFIVFLSFIFANPWDYTVQRLDRRSNFQIREVRAKGVESVEYILREEWKFAAIPPEVLEAAQRCHQEKGWELLWAHSGTPRAWGEPLWIACLARTDLRRLQWALYKLDVSNLGPTRLPETQPPFARVWRVGKDTFRDSAGPLVPTNSSTGEEVGPWWAFPPGDHVTTEGSGSGLLHLPLPLHWTPALRRTERLLRLQLLRRSFGSSSLLEVWVRGEGYGGEVREAGERPQGLRVGVPHRFVKAAWTPQGRLVLWESLGPEGPSPVEVPETSHAFGWEPLPPQTVPEDIAALWEPLPEKCDPFAYECHLQTFPDCSQGGYLVGVEVTLGQRTRDWELTFRQLDDAACPVECSQTIKENAWAPWLPGPSQVHLQRQALRCFKASDREKCFREGARLPWELVSEAVIPFLTPVNSSTPSEDLDFSFNDTFVNETFVNDTFVNETNGRLENGTVIEEVDELKASALVWEVLTLCGVQKVPITPRGNTRINSPLGVHTLRS